MLALITAVFAASAIFLFVAGRVILRSFAMSEGEARLRGLVQPKTTGKRSPVALIRRSPSSIPILKDILSGKLGEKMQAHLERADIGMTSGEYVMLRAALVVIPMIVGLLLFGPSTGLLVGAVLGIAGFVGPTFYVRMRTAARVDAIGEQLAQFLRLTANALRAGFALLQAIEAASRDLEPPLQTELERLLLDTRMGANTEVALRAFSDRAESYEAKAMITAILIQRTTGGNLAEVLDNVANSLEERDRIRGEVRSFTAQQRMTGNILSVYPLLLAGFFILIHPGMMSILWTDPVGIILLVIGGSLQLTGFFVIRRIVNVEY